MTVRTLFFLPFALCAGLLSAAETEYKLKKAAQPPKELSKDVQAALDPAGFQVVGPKGPLVEVWLVKEAAVKPGFSPTFTVKYPFTSGQLIGALRVAKGAEFTDFRAQEVPAGVYTLRYGQQPMDGNHIGTADTADFLMTLPAAMDTDPALIRFTGPLREKSAASVETGHPAILWLAPPAEEEKAGAPAVVHDEDRDFWILNVPVKGDEMPVPLRLVVVGEGAV